MRVLCCFLLTLLLAASFCHGDQKKTVEVVGVGECADCAETNIKPTHAVKGLRVSIDCKAPKGETLKTRGAGELDGEGNFKVSLPEEMVEDGKLKEECYAQLHSANAIPCPSHDGSHSTKLVLKSASGDGQKHTFGLSGKLRFSPALCASSFLWHHPPLPKLTFPPFKGFGHHHHFSFPPIHKIPLPPPVPVYHKPPPVSVYHEPPPVPVYHKPPPVPVYHKPPPVPVVKKPCPPPVPVYHKPPPVPVYHKPPPVPVYHKPPHVPVYHKPPSVPVYHKPPPVPIYHKPPPVYNKPLSPPIPKKPCPPLPKLPPIPKKKPCPPIPKLPPHKFFHHPKYGKFPPLTPPHF